MNKIRLFLGGYVNFLNAQNINCRAISEHIDKSRFRVTTMLFWYENARDFKPTEGVRYLKVRRPARLWRRLAYLRGIASADVAYLPKGEIDRYCRAVAHIFRTKVFTTVEGMIDELNISRHAENLAKYGPNLYAITKYMKSKIGKSRDYKFNERVLYLGVDSKFFSYTERKHCGLKNIIFIGNTPSIKNVYDFFEAARLNPDLNFHMVGGNTLKDGTVEGYIRDHNLANITYHGSLDHTSLARLLHDMDLMYFPSRSEGFPKVHLETASAGVPTLCYGDYGATEWITPWENGIVVDTKEEAFTAIGRLKTNPALLAAMSDNAVKLSRRFDWNNLIADWEREIQRIALAK